MRMIILGFSAALLSGCLSTAVDVVTLPVRAAAAVVGEGIDAVTTTQAERDRAEGRRLREEDERRGRESRQAQREADRQVRIAAREAREAERRGEPTNTEPE